MPGQDQNRRQRQRGRVHGNIDPKYANAWKHRGVAWFDKGDISHAITDYDQAIRLNPKDAASYDHRGVACDRLGQRAKAIADFDESIRLDPERYGNPTVGLFDTWSELEQARRAGMLVGATREQITEKMSDKDFMNKIYDQVLTSRDGQTEMSNVGMEKLRAVLAGQRRLSEQEKKSMARVHTTDMVQLAVVKVLDTRSPGGGRSWMTAPSG